MKTILGEDTRDELITRIRSLNENSKRQWGKMTVFQMLKHCTLWDEWVQGKSNVKSTQSFLGKIFGRMALKSIIKDDRPIQKNLPAGNFKVEETSGDVDAQKDKWIQSIKDYGHFSNTQFVHDFFGPMTSREIGIFAFKHVDHHLRQFGC